MTNRYRIALIALTFTVGAWSSSTAHADAATDAAMEPVWKHYWAAVAAAQQCENRKFSTPEFDAMTHYINGKVNNAVGAGQRTHLIDDARSDVWDRSFKYGCKDRQIDELLAVYHNELEPTFR